MQNTIEIVSLVVSIITLMVTIYFSFLAYKASNIAQEASKELKKNNEIFDIENENEIKRKKLIIKTWNEMKSAFEKYSILVPKLTYSNNHSSDHWDNIVLLFRNESIIYESVKIFFHKFEDNWDNLNKMATSGLRNELEKLQIEEIEEIFNFWKKINKKLGIIDPIIEKLKILEIDHHDRTNISDAFKNLEYFYINLCPEYDKCGLWGSSISTPRDKFPYSNEQFNILIKKDGKNFEKELNSKKWNLEVKFLNSNDNALKYIFSVKYENDEIIDIKNDLNEKRYHPHKDSFCTCHRNKTEILSEEQKRELNMDCFGLMRLTELLKKDITGSINFLKNTEDSKCQRIKYLKSELELLLK